MGELERARSAFQAKAWGAAFSEFVAADRLSALEPMDLVLLAQAALLTGKEAEGAEYLGRAHHAFLAGGYIQPAARCGFWLGFTSLLNGEHAKSSGWFARVARLLEDQPDCVEKGYLFLPKAYRWFHEGNTAAAMAAFAEVIASAEKFGDKDLLTYGLQGQGRTLIRGGEIDRGLALLDEAMVAVTAGEVSPLNAGGVYCSVLEACGEIFDFKRAQEWTTELERWCESQPDLVPYRGHCLIRRTELLVLRGQWEEAANWARRAIEFLSLPAPKVDVGSAYYELGEIQRLFGKLDEAEDAYRRAEEWNRASGAGIARLRLAQGRTEVALVLIRRLAEHKREPGRRALLLDAYVEIALAAGDLECARDAATELEQIAERLDAPFLHALSGRAWGTVLCAEGDAAGALSALTQSLSLWQELRAPYETARVQHALGCAFLKLGDGPGAAQEFDSARRSFEKLGAVGDVASIETLIGPPRSEEGKLTARELDVLRLVACGMTNKEIANALKISEKTVARHLSNIFTKLDLSSRSAATAYAYDHKLVSGDSRGAKR